MRATVFYGPGDIRVEEVPRPHAGAGEAVIRITTTTICGTDVHIVKGEYPVRAGLVIGHERRHRHGRRGRIVYANAHVEETFGFPSAQLMEDVKNLLGDSSIVLTSNTYGHEPRAAASGRWRWGWMPSWAA